MALLYLKLYYNITSNNQYFQKYKYEIKQLYRQAFRPSPGLNYFVMGIADSYSSFSSDIFPCCHVGSEFYLIMKSY